MSTRLFTVQRTYGKPEELRREFFEAAGNGNLAGLIEPLAADGLFTPMAAVKRGALTKRYPWVIEAARALMSGLGRVPTTLLSIAWPR